MGGKKTLKKAEQGYLPCFSKHDDKKYLISSFYATNAFVHKVQTFLGAIVLAPNIQKLQELLGGNHIQHIDPQGNPNDRKLCERLGWQESKVYRVDYGDTPYRLLFGLKDARCFILALDSNHDTRSDKQRR